MPKGYERLHSDATTLEYYFAVRPPTGFKILDGAAASVIAVVLSAAACGPKALEIGQTPDRNILLINGSPTENNALNYRHIYKLEKDGKRNTRIKRIISHLVTA